MVMPIDKRIKREFKKNFMRYFLVALILFFGITMISAFFSSTDGVLDTIESEREKCSIEDANVTLVSELTDDNEKKLKDLGVELLENTSYSDLHAFEDEEYELRVFKVRKDVNKLTITEGNLPEKTNEIVLEEKTAVAKGISVGDEFDIDGKEYVLSGIVNVVDYNNVLKSVTSGVSNFDVFGVGFVSEDAFKNISDDKLTIQYSFTVADEDDIDSISDYLKDESILMSILKRTDNPRIKSIDNKTATMKAEVILIGIVFIFLISFIFYVMSSASIEKDSTFIGTLFSMGYTRGEIVRHYLKLPLIVTLISSVVGMIVGALCISETIGKTTYSSYSLSSFAGKINAYLIILCCVMPFVIQMITNGLLLSNRLNITPIKLMRGKTMSGKGFRKVKLEKKSFPVKMYIRIMLRGLKNQLVLFLGIFIAMFFLVMGFGMKDTLKEYVKDVDENSMYEYGYILKAPCEPENDDTDYQKITLGSFQVTYAGINMKLNVYGYGEGEGVESISTSKDEIVVSDSTASKLSLKKGDDFEIYSTELKKSFTLKVIDIVHDPVGLTAFMDRTALNELLEEDDADEYYNAIVSDEELDIPEAYVAEKMTHSVNKLAAEEMDSMMQTMIMMLIFMAVVVFAAVMFILLKMIIEKSAYSISLMKIFGYTNKENNHFYLNSFLITIIISLAVSLPLDVVLFKSVWPMLNANLVGFVPVKFYPITYVIILVFGLAVYFVITLLLRSKLRRIPMNMILKQRD
jgi:putative ABC transport system permease protein